MCREIRKLLTIVVVILSLISIIFAQSGDYNYDDQNIYNNQEFWKEADYSKVRWEFVNYFENVELSRIPDTKWISIDQSKMIGIKVAEIPPKHFNPKQVLKDNLKYAKEEQISAHISEFDNLRYANPIEVKNVFLKEPHNADLDISGAVIVKYDSTSGRLIGNFPSYNPKQYPKEQFKQIIIGEIVKIIPLKKDEKGQLAEDSGNAVTISGAEGFTRREDGSIDLSAKIGQNTIITGHQKGIITLQDGIITRFESEGTISINSDGIIQGQGSKVILEKNGIVQKIIEGKFRKIDDAVTLESFDGQQSSFEDKITNIRVNTVGYPLVILPEGTAMPTKLAEINNIVSYGKQNLLTKGAVEVFKDDLHIFSKDEKSLFSLKEGVTFAYGRTGFEDSGIDYEGLTDSSQLIRKFERNNELVTINGVDEGEIAKFTRKVEIGDLFLEEGFVSGKVGITTIISNDRGKLKLDIDKNSLALLAEIENDPTKFVLVDRNLVLELGDKQAYFEINPDFGMRYETSEGNIVTFLSPMNTKFYLGESVEGLMEANSLMGVGKKEKSYEELQKVIDTHPYELQGRQARLILATSFVNDAKNMIKAGNIQEAQDLLLKAKIIYSGQPIELSQEEFSTSLAQDKDYLSKAYLGLAEIEKIRSQAPKDINLDPKIRKDLQILAENNIRHYYQRAIDNQPDAEIASQIKLTYTHHLIESGQIQSAVEQYKETLKEYSNTEASEFARRQLNIIYAGTHASTMADVLKNEITKLQKEQKGETILTANQRLKIGGIDGLYTEQESADGKKTNLETALRLVSIMYSSANPILILKDVPVSEAESTGYAQLQEQSLKEQSYLLQAIIGKIQSKQASSIRESIAQIPNEQYIYRENPVGTTEVYRLIQRGGVWFSVGIDEELPPELPAQDKETALDDIPSSKVEGKFPAIIVNKPEGVYQKGFKIVSTESIKALSDNEFMKLILTQEDLTDQFGSIHPDNENIIKLSLAHEYRQRGMYETARKLLSEIPPDTSIVKDGKEITAKQELESSTGVGTFGILTDEFKEGVPDMLASMANPLMFVGYGAAGKAVSYGLNKLGATSLQTGTKSALSGMSNFFGRSITGRTAGVVTETIAEEVVLEPGANIIGSVIGTTISGGNILAGQILGTAFETFAIALTGGPDVSDIVQANAKRSALKKAFENANDVRISNQMFEFNDKRGQVIDYVGSIDKSNLEVSGATVNELGNGVFELESENGEAFLLRPKGADVKDVQILQADEYTNEVIVEAEAQAKWEEAQAVMGDGNLKVVKKGDLSGKLTKRPESIEIQLSNGKTLIIEPATIGQDLRLQATAKRVGVEVPADIYYETEVLNDNVMKITEMAYEIPKKMGDVVVLKGDEYGYLSSQDNDLRSRLDTLQGRLSLIAADLNGVDLEKSFGVTKSLNELSWNERLDIAKKVSTASEIRTFAFNEEFSGTEGTIWLKESDYSLITPEGLKILNSLRKLEEKKLELIESGLLSRVDLEKTYSITTPLEDMSSEQKKELIDRLMEVKTYSAEKMTSHLKSGYYRPYKAHTHPIATTYTSYSLKINKELEELFSGHPFDTKFWTPETADRVRVIAEEEIEKLIKPYTFLRDQYRDELLEIDKSTNPERLYLAARKNEIKGVLVRNEPDNIAYAEDILERDGVLHYNFDPITGNRLDKYDTQTGDRLIENSKRRLELFLRDVDHTHVPEKAIDNFRVEIRQAINKYESSIQEKLQLLDLVRKGTDRDLYFAAIFPGTFTPSSGDIHTLFVPGRVIKLPDTTKVKIEKIVFPHGISYAFYEEGSGKIKIITTRASDYKVEEVPKDVVLQRKPESFPLP